MPKQASMGQRREDRFHRGTYLKFGTVLHWISWLNKPQQPGGQCSLELTAGLLFLSVELAPKNNSVGSQNGQTGSWILYSFVDPWVICLDAAVKDPVHVFRNLSCCQLMKWVVVLPDHQQSRVWRANLTHYQCSQISQISSHVWLASASSYVIFLLDLSIWRQV